MLPSYLVAGLGVSRRGRDARGPRPHGVLSGCGRAARADLCVRLLACRAARPSGLDDPGEERPREARPARDAGRRRDRPAPLAAERGGACASGSFAPGCTGPGRGRSSATRSCSPSPARSYGSGSQASKGSKRACLLLGLVGDRASVLAPAARVRRQPGPQASRLDRARPFPTSSICSSSRSRPA